MRAVCALGEKHEAIASAVVSGPQTNVACDTRRLGNQKRMSLNEPMLIFICQHDQNTTGLEV